MESSFTFLRVRGIPIGAHWSWLLVAGLFVWSLSTALFPLTHPGLGTATYVAMAVVAAVLFFVSVLLHELGHAFRALREGMEIDGITLWLFGGVAAFKGTFPSAGAEFRIAVAGPAVSLVLGVAFSALGLLGASLGLPEPVVGVADYVGRINLILLAFNLVPALPLDGGRVLRSWLWSRQRDFVAATAGAARAGKAFGGVLAIVGLLNFFTGPAGGGLWLLFLGWFLMRAAEAEASSVLVHQIMRGRKVGDLMTSDPITVDVHMTVKDFIAQVAAEHQHPAYPVTDDDELVGMATLSRVRSLSEETRARATVRDIMVPAGDVAALSRDTDAVDALEELRSEPRRAVVLEDGRLVGIMSITDVARTLELQSALGPAPRPKARPAGLVVWAVVTLVFAVAAGALYHPPLVVLEPGPTLDVATGVEIRGVPTDELTGTYLLTSVRLARPNGLGVLFALLAQDREVVPVSQVVPPGVERDEYFRRQREVFDQSRVVAAAAAAQASGLEVGVGGTGAVVASVLEGTPAAATLEAGDVIVAIDGREVNIAQNLQEAIRSRPAGTTFRMTIQRDGSQRNVTVTSTRLTEVAEGSVGIGVVISTRDFEIDLPFEIDFAERDIGGPSAGLAYALAVADLLQEQDYAQGVVGATGTIDVDGQVGPIGGIEAKAEGLEDAGAAVFVVPERQLDQLGEVDLDVRGVSSLREALEVLEQGADNQ
jgi:PDZ domain-containing secreted protein/Zn-dependent protease/predicted transcriptional regulator